MRYIRSKPEGPREQPAPEKSIEPTTHDNSASHALLERIAAGVEKIPSLTPPAPPTPPAKPEPPKANAFTVRNIQRDKDGRMTQFDIHPKGEEEKEAIPADEKAFRDGYGPH